MTLSLYFLSWVFCFVAHEIRKLLEKSCRIARKLPMDNIASFALKCKRIMSMRDQSTFMNEICIWRNFTQYTNAWVQEKNKQMCKQPNMDITQLIRNWTLCEVGEWWKNKNRIWFLYSWLFTRKASPLRFVDSNYETVTLSEMIFNL